VTAGRKVAAQASRTAPRPLPALAVVAAFGASNFVFNHTAIGRTLLDVPWLYVGAYYIGLGVLAPALVMVRSVRGETREALRTIGFGFGWRDLLSALVVLGAGGWLAVAVVSADLEAMPPRAEVVATFSVLLVASTAETFIFCGLVGGLLPRLTAGDSAWARLAGAVVASVTFGVFHFTYPAPWDTAALAARLSVVWLVVSGVHLLTRSLLAATLFNNAMALIGFLSSGLELPGSTASGLRDFAWSAAAVVYAGAVHRPVDTESAGGG
jgi:hypothetical protein